MSYNSYKKASSRPFDHLYDKNFRCNLQRINRLNKNAIKKTANVCIMPCYFAMFSNGLRNFHLKQENPLPIDVTNVCCKQKFACNSLSFNKNLCSHAPIKSLDKDKEASTGIKLNEINKNALKTFRSVQSQTKYRETETQTKPYLPEAKIRQGEHDIPEILKINFCDKDEVLIATNLDKIDRARVRRNWEKTLRKNSSTLVEDKLKQLEVFEWSEYLYREKEINMMQNERLQHVISSLNVRQQATREIEAKIVSNVKNQSFIELEKKKSALQLKFQRKLRKISKAYGKITEKDLMIPKKQRIFKVSREFDICQVNNTDCHAVAVFKNYLEHKNYVELKLRNICKILFSRQVKNESLKCLMRKNDNEDNCYSSVSCNTVENDSDEDYNNRIEIHRVLKGKAIQKKVQKEMLLRIEEITSFQNQFPLKYAQHGISMKNHEKCDKITEESKKEEKLKEQVTEFINDALNEINVIVRDSFNQTLLREAEELRKQRYNQKKIHELEIDMKQKVCEKIQAQLSRLQQDITNEIMEKIIPVAIEFIAQKEALNFITKKAKNYNESSLNVHHHVKKILIDLVPLIEEKISSQNDQLCALLASNDVFDDFLEKCFNDLNPPK